jgi:hypothetical protein
MTPKMKAFLKYLFIALITMGVLCVVLAIWPYRLVASPGSTLRIVDENGRPFVGLKVIRQWETSENQKGEDKNVTDDNGQVHFERIGFHISWLKRITKPLLVLVPAPCGLDWEIYGEAKFDIYWPQDYTVRFDDKEWEKIYATYENHDGIHIYDPVQATDKSYVELYVFNKREDFTYTLTLYQQNHK